MSKTLTYNDSITRTGYTTIDGKVALQHVCTINTGNPEEMSLVSSKIDLALCKENRDICRSDTAEFEDLAYELQDKYMKGGEAQS